MTGFSMIANDPKVLIMIAISLVLMYLAIVKKFEPLLLLPIAFGMLLTNLPGAEMYHRELFASGHVDWAKLSDQGGLIDYLYLGIKLGIYPCLIFMGVGAGTDFAPLSPTPRPCSWVLLPSWAYSLPSWVPSALPPCSPMHSTLA